MPHLAAVPKEDLMTGPELWSPEVAIVPGLQLVSSPPAIKPSVMVNLKSCRKCKSRIQVTCKGIEQTTTQMTTQMARLMTSLER